MLQVLTIVLTLAREIVAMTKPIDLTAEQAHRKYLDDLLEEMFMNGTPITKEESARIDAEMPPFVPQTNPRRMAVKIPISELLKARAEEVAMTEQIENSDTPGLAWSKMPIEEALRICRGTMTKEESDRLDAETPPFVAETRNGYMTYREEDLGPKRAEPKF